jgi:hypothetical protein
MNKIKSIWTTISGSISSIIPMFFTVCKSGACTAVCVSPIASVLGISSASLTASPIMQSLVPLLLVISAVSFTVSYYKLYVLPKYATSKTNCETDCACETPTQSKQYKFSLYTFWIGLLTSIIFFTYFEYQNYKANTQKLKAEISTKTEEPCCASGTTCYTTATIKEVVKDTTGLEKPCCTETQKCEK